MQKDIEDAQAFRAASLAHAGAATWPIGPILDRLEQEFRITFTEQMRADNYRQLSPIAMARVLS